MGLDTDRYSWYMTRVGDIVPRQGREGPGCVAAGNRKGAFGCSRVSPLADWINMEDGMSVVYKTVLQLEWDAIWSLANALAKGADLYAKKVENDNDFAHWKTDFELWRDETWEVVEEDLGSEIVNLYKPIGDVGAALGVVADLGPDADDSFNADHRILRAVLHIYITRIRALVKKYGLGV